MWLAIRKNFKLPGDDCLLLVMRNSFDYFCAANMSILKHQYLPKVDCQFPNLQLGQPIVNFLIASTRSLEKRSICFKKTRPLPHGRGICHFLTLSHLHFLSIPSNDFHSHTFHCPSRAYRAT